MSDVSDRERFEFEREKWRADIAMRGREVAVKEREQASSKWRSPLVVAILAATAAAVGNAVVAVVNGGQQVALEDSKAESARILEMTKTGDTEAAARNLEFLLRSGLIANTDRAKKVTAFLATRTPGTGPSLPAPSGKVAFEASENLTDSLKQSLDKLMQDYVSSLDKIGFAAGERVRVKIEPTQGGPNAHYLDNMIVIDPKLASDPSVPLREYNHHVLASTHKEPRQGSYAAIESGIADYLGCSFLNNPRLGEIAAKAFGQNLPYIRNMANDKKFDEVKGKSPDFDFYAIGEAWSGAFWAMRTMLGRDVSDPIVVAAWRTMKWPNADAEKPLAFTTALLAAAGEKGPDQVKTVRSILLGRRFPLPN
jgi:hypothetical protein